MAEEIAPPARPGGSGGSPIQKGERFASKHKVLVIGGGGALAFLYLSTRGKSSTLALTPDTTALPTVDESTGGAGTDDPGPTNDDPTLPPDDTTPTTDPTTPTDAPTDPAPVPAPITLGPTAPTPTVPSPAAAPPPPVLTQGGVASGTLSTDPAQTTVPAPPPSATTAPQGVPTYQDVPGFFTNLQTYTRATGEVDLWHHYTSGTRKGDKVMVSVVGTTTKNIVPPASDGWVRASIISSADYERPIGSVQYESTHTATVGGP